MALQVLWTSAMTFWAVSGLPKIAHAMTFWAVSGLPKMLLGRPGEHKRPQAAVELGHSGHTRLPGSTPGSAQQQWVAE